MPDCPKCARPKTPARRRRWVCRPCEAAVDRAQRAAARAARERFKASFRRGVARG